MGKPHRRGSEPPGPASLNAITCNLIYHIMAISFNLWEYSALTENHYKIPYCPTVTYNSRKLEYIDHNLFS